MPIKGSIEIEGYVDGDGNLTITNAPSYDTDTQTHEYVPQSDTMTQNRSFALG